MTFANDLLGTHVHQADLPASFATADTEDEHPIFKAPKRVKVTGISIVPATAITADATNHAVISAQNKGAAGTGTTEVATFAFDTVTTDDVAAFNEKALTLSATAANLILAAGDILSIKKTTPGTGQVVEGIVIVEYEPVGS